METIINVSPPISPTFRFSFGPFIDYLRAQQEATPTGDMHGLYGYIIDQFEQIPLHNESLPNLIQPSRLAELFQLASITVLPLSSLNQGVPYAFGLPMPLTILHQSTAFAQLLEQIPDLLSEVHTQVCEEDKIRFMYSLVLKKCYGIESIKNPTFSFHFQKEINGLTKHLRININNLFVKPHYNGLFPALQPEWVDFVNGTGQRPAGQHELPMQEFTFEGFSFFMIEDVTESKTIEQLQDVFAHLQSDTEGEIYHRFETALRNLCGQPDLQISITPLPKVNDHFVHHPDLRKRSVFLRHSDADFDGSKDSLGKIAKKIIQHPTPFLFPNLEGMPQPEREAFQQKGIRSFLIYPITTVNEMLGILEMGSPQPDALNEVILTRIERILPLIQELLRYQLNQFNDTLEQFVKKKFTSLQPSVKWKFYEVAWQHILSGNKELGGNEAAQVRFPQVYPFYGAIDIRNSSVERNKALRLDLTNQLTAVNELIQATVSPPEPAWAERIMALSHQWQQQLTIRMKPEDEQSIARFLVQEVNPYFRHLYPNQVELQDALEHYFNQTDPQTGQFGQASKAYERSLDWINATVSDYFNQEEKRLQALYPHYFERYRTDGMEYTIYVGQSIAPDAHFELDFRRRMSDWQLTSMVEMAQLTHRLLPLLPLPLQTTQLILAHSHSVDIGFRQDEHRFDVEGSYSIRYEVLKKRIDKAFIEGTQERLTQPDSVAIVYTHTAELTDYLPVINSLQEQGKLRADIEYLDLEPLQGVASLKALRVYINYAA
ncbi:GAF domain-containing protein [Spirosoma soli]|uniref:GAF domain-containing protein n=1 Tax=Spirosoma soli TaxID=1770529 RepID=A0ABW5M6Q1_9BACT